MENDKQTQRIIINEAIKDFLSRGGTIKKVDLKEVDVNQNVKRHNDDFISMNDVYTQDSSNFTQLKKRFEFDETW